MSTFTPALIARCSSPVIRSNHLSLGVQSIRKLHSSKECAGGSKEGGLRLACAEEGGLFNVDCGHNYGKTTKPLQKKEQKMRPHSTYVSPSSTCRSQTALTLSRHDTIFEKV